MMKKRKLTARVIPADSGFTLIELVLATAISAIVIGILSVCLSFSLRAWESTQNRRPDQTSNFIDLFQRQLAEFDPTPIRFTESAHMLFSGSSRAIAFATSHSVKAISQGVPVIAHYVYDPGAKVLYYSEMPLDPYHSKQVQDFVKAAPIAKEKSKYRFYAIGLAEFSLGYAGKDDSRFLETWDSDNQSPTQVLLKWTSDTGSKAQLLLVNSPFVIQADKVVLPAGGIPQGGMRQ